MSALYMNGVFEEVVEEIRTAQEKHPGLVCYMQPQKKSKIAEFASSPPSAFAPTDFYISLTGSLGLVSYRAMIVGWEDKTQMSAERIATVDAQIAEHQPTEGLVSAPNSDGKIAVNLISVTNMEKLASPIPVSSFVKISNGEPLRTRTRSGGWSYVRPIPDWLGRTTETQLAESATEALEKGVARSLKDNDEARKARLTAANERPEVIQILSQGFKRNPDVVAEVLRRANGVCERCLKDAPFIRRSDGTPYLEVHHLVTLAEGGLDTVDNAQALCPNCHRELHFGA